MNRQRWKKYGFTAEVIVLTLTAVLCWKDVSDGAFAAGRNTNAAADVPDSGTIGEESAGTNGEEGSAAGSGEDSATENVEKDYIKWVDFHVTSEAMRQACAYDVDTYGQEGHLNWVDLLAYLGARYGGDFKQYKAKDMDEIADRLQKGETTVEKLSVEIKSFDYYREAYGAVLDGLVGEYEIEAENEGQEVQSRDSQEVQNRDSQAEEGRKEDQNDQESPGTVNWTKKYGLKGFSPIAKSFPYNDYDDFGVARSYGYKREHLGHDMMGQTGTPIVAVESGYVSAMGWNQYGGWRLGIYMAADIRCFNTFDTVMHNLGSHIQVIYLENTLLHTFTQNLLEKLGLCSIETFAHFLHSPNIPKEIGTKSTIPKDNLFYRIQMSVNHFHQFLVRLNIFLYHVLHHIRKNIQLRLDNSQVDIFLALKIGIERSPTFLRSEGNIIHRGILNAHLCKQLTGNVH